MSDKVNKNKPVINYLDESFSKYSDFQSEEIWGVIRAGIDEGKHVFETFRFTESRGEVMDSFMQYTFQLPNGLEWCFSRRYVGFPLISPRDKLSRPVR